MDRFHLPPPKMRIGRQRKWDRGSIRACLAAAAGEPPPPPRHDDEYLVGSNELRQMLGGVSDMFLWRHSRRVDRQPPDCSATLLEPRSPRQPLSSPGSPPARRSKKHARHDVQAPGNQSVPSKADEPMLDETAGE